MGALRLMPLLLVLLAAAARAATAAGARPSEVAVGALFTYDSVIGRAARLAIELAVDDVNADRTVLAATQLSLIAQDTNCSGFLGTIEGLLLSASPLSLSLSQLLMFMSSSRAIIRVISSGKIQLTDL